jgi:hypothetical protein
MPLASLGNNAFSAHFTFLTISLRPLNQLGRPVRHYEPDDEDPLRIPNRICGRFVNRISIKPTGGIMKRFIVSTLVISLAFIGA